MIRHPDEWRAKRRGALRLLRRLPATGAHTSTTDHPVSTLESQVPALESKDRCRAILKNQGTRRSLPHRLCGCQYPLVRCCSSHRDKTPSWGVTIAKFSGHAVTFRSSPTVLADTAMPRSTSTRIRFGKLPRAISSAATLLGLYRMARPSHTWN